MTKKKHYRPKLEPDVDLAGATPETLALALLGRKPKVKDETDDGLPAVQHADPEPVREAEPPRG